MDRYKTVDDYIANATVWREELIRLRGILQHTALLETVKWGGPCYTHQGRNVVGLSAFKSYVGLWFHQGALLTDPDQVLINAQEGTTRALRQWRFTDKDQIRAGRIKAYVSEAVALVDAGHQIMPVRDKPLRVPDALRAALAEQPAAQQAFEAMGKGRRREYADYIAEAKREETRMRRIDKVLPLILDGGGLHDRYRKPPAS